VTPAHEPEEPHDDAATLLSKSAVATEQPVASFVLVVVQGPDLGARCKIDASRPSRTFVGQSAACDLRLSDPHVSRRHAAFDATSRGLRLTDLRSTNGTFVGEVAVVEVFLRGGEQVTLGATTLRVDVDAPEKPDLPAALRFGRVVGASQAMRRIYPLCERLAATDVPVVIEGETGTGKELLAEALHEQGPRPNSPFVVFDCTAVPPNLVESALFGHERGAFTGAVNARKGVFELAHGGTLFIDEIGDLDIGLQPKLLRALERSEIQRVGGEKFLRVEVRVIAATRRDLDREVQAGRFRDDLFFRLAVARVELPPLRQREGDVGVLGRHFWRTLGGGNAPLPPDLLQRFEDYDWPGNVRELHNTVVRRIALGDLGPIPKRKPADAAGGGAQGAPTAPQTVTVPLDLPFSAARQRVIEDFERIYVEHVLARHGGNVVRAATASGIARRYFYVLKARQQAKG
jgi:two-component system response regulator HydG